MDMYGPDIEARGGLDLQAIFHGHHGQFIRVMMRRAGCSRDEAQDLVQQVYIVAVRNAHRYDASGPACAWIHGIVRNVALHYRRACARWRSRHGEAVNVEALRDPGRAADMERSLDDRVAFQRVLRALGDIDPRLRAIYVLCEMRELPVQLAARRLCIPLSTAYHRLTAAKRMLCARLSG